MHRLYFLLLVCFSASGLSGQTYWNQVVSTGDIPARDYHGMVYDETGNRLIVFGGRSDTTFFNDIWTLDLSSLEWAEITSISPVQPEPRHTAQVFLDPENNLWTTTGRSSLGFHNDVWKFNFQDSTWTEVFADTIGVGICKPRYGTAGIYDEITNNFVLFAGFATIGRVKDTHAFSLDSLVWTNRGLPERPGERCLYDGIFAEDRREFWIFGGRSIGNLDNTWRMAVDSFVWQEFLPPVVPPARHFHSLAYRGNSEMILYGGNAAAPGEWSGVLGDLWKFDGDLVEWDTLPQGTVLPEARSGQAAVYIPDMDQMFILGGRNINGEFLNNLWVYDFNPVNVAITDPDEHTEHVGLTPNPAGDRFTLSFNKPVSSFKVKIFDSSGRLLEVSSSSKTQFDVSPFPPGIYFVQIITKESNFVLKLAVE